MKRNHATKKRILSLFLALLMCLSTVSLLASCGGGGAGGGTIVAEGTPEEVAMAEGSYTGKYLRGKLGL